MKYYSVVFAPEEIKALMEGTKTMFRRPLTHPPTVQPDGRWSFIVSSTDKTHRNKFAYYYPNPEGFTFTERGKETRVIYRSPFGLPGDIIWGKEVWTQYPIEFREDVCDAWWKAPPGYAPPVDTSKGLYAWKPAITMPKWASRLWLKILDVRIEKLSELSYQDSIKEGFPEGPEDCTSCTLNCCERHPAWGQEAYLGQWDRLRGNRREDPFVWVVSFEKLTHRR